MPHDKKVQMEIIALSHSVTQSNNYAVVLQEKGKKRRLPIVIGGFEAQAIAVSIERMRPNRPLTHDLFKNVMDTFHIRLESILITDLKDGIFYAQLVCTQNGVTQYIDSRTSDAIALAVRFGVPIFASTSVLEEAGVTMEAEEPTPITERSDAGKEGDPTGKSGKKKKSDWSFEDYSNDELQKILQDVIEKEDYEKAALIRDEINRRKSGK